MNSNMPVAQVTAISANSWIVERAAAAGNLGGARRGAVATSRNKRLGSTMRRRLAEHQERHDASETVRLCQRLAAVLEDSADLVMFGDASGRITSVNSTACRLLGKSREQLLGAQWEIIYVPSARKQMRRVLMGAVKRTGTWQGEIGIVAHDGVVIDTAQVVTAHKDDTGRADYFSLVARELSDRHAYEERIRKLQNYDSLTGLPSLLHVKQVVQQLIAQGRRDHGVVVLVSLNLDGFRLVDEGFGREVGDEVLKAISLLLRDAVRQRDVVARIAADEFVVILSESAEWNGTSAFVQGLLDFIAAPRIVAGQTLRLTASAGVAAYPADSCDVDALLGKSHAAMCLAKSKSHGGFQFCSGDVEQLARRQLKLETDLRNAISQNELTLHYQPQFEIKNGSLSGVEALARWTTGSGDVISPAIFIPMAEERGLIGALGTWVLEKACSTAVKWCGTDNKLLTIGVNVSSLQLGTEFIATVAHALEVSECSADRLELELTESALLINPKFSIGCLLELKRLGVRIALDDFGTGYSSLSYLARLPVDRLKIDQTLVQSMPTNRKSAAIVRTIITLAKDLGLVVIAEGVETTQQLEMLYELGCDQAQGYLLGLPRPTKPTCSAVNTAWDAGSMPRSRPVRCVAEHACGA
jgi:diguanylate cyclase (GGDEF)-like protein/PAS domain S-box-containing protein